MNKKESISVRLSQEDYQFLMGVDCNGALTQSDKVREVIRMAREGSREKSLLSTLLQAETLMRPYRLEQFKSLDTSPLVSSVIDFMTEALFQMEQAQTSDGQFLSQVEERLKPMLDKLIQHRQASALTDEPY